MQEQAEQIENDVFTLRTLLDQAKIAKSQTVMELFKARASVMENIAEAISARAMPGVSDDCKASTMSIKET